MIEKHRPSEIWKSGFRRPFYIFKPSADLYAQKLFAEEAAFFDTRQDEEIAAAKRADVFLQRLAVEQVLHEDEAVGKVGLIADKNQADIELAVGGKAARVVEGAAVRAGVFS